MIVVTGAVESEFVVNVAPCSETDPAAVAFVHLTVSVLPAAFARTKSIVKTTLVVPDAFVTLVSVTAAVPSFS